MRKNPALYGQPQNLSESAFGERLQRLALSNITKLHESVRSVALATLIRCGGIVLAHSDIVFPHRQGLVEFDKESKEITSTKYGSLVYRFFLKFETAVLFREIEPHSSLEDVLAVVGKLPWAS